MPVSTTIDAHMRQVRWGCALLGFALGGFFDGILLHQILQWHHLLSGLETGPYLDLGFQVMVDGLFHFAMYVLGVAGLALLLRARLAVLQARFVLGWTLIGFGVWHVIDAVLVHWILGLHRIRMDAESPLLWDLAWLAIFGVGFLAGGAWALRGGGHTGRGGLRVLSCLALVWGASAALFTWPLAKPTSTVVVLLPAAGATAVTVFEIAEQAGVPVLAADASGTIWVLGAPVRPLPMYRDGALIGASMILPPGCLSWAAGPPPTRTL